MMLIYKIIHKLIYFYQKMDEKYTRLQLGKCGSNSNIRYPSIVCPGKAVFLGNNTQILAYSRLQTYSQLTNIEANIRIGNNCFIGYRFCALVGSDITIEDDNLIASNVCILSESHGIDPSDDSGYQNQPLQCASVHIGKGCWIGEQAIILPGVKIGKKCIIGAGSVVTRDIPDYSIAVGNPARVIKKYDSYLREWVRCKEGK